VAVLLFCELETTYAVGLPLVRRDNILVTLQKEYELRNLLVSLSPVYTAGLVSNNSQKYGLDNSAVHFHTGAR